MQAAEEDVLGVLVGRQKIVEGAHALAREKYYGTGRRERARAQHRISVIIIPHSRRTFHSRGEERAAAAAPCNAVRVANCDKGVQPRRRGSPHNQARESARKRHTFFFISSSLF